MKVFYNRTTKLTIEDLSGLKDLATIKRDFGDGDFIQMKVDEVSQIYRVENDQIIVRTKEEANRILLKLNEDERKIREELRRIAYESLKKRGEI